MLKDKDTLVLEFSLYILFWFRIIFKFFYYTKR